MIPRPLKNRVVLALLTGAALLVLLSCNPSDPQSTFEAASPEAQKLLDLLAIIGWAAVAVFVVVEGILIYAVIRYARRRNENVMPAQTHGNTPLEIAWTIAPAIVLAVIAVPTVIYIFDLESEPPEHALNVIVTGHQWWWEFEYPEENVITANELRLPVERPVRMVLRSDDVIHSFWIPKLQGQGRCDTYQRKPDEVHADGNGRVLRAVRRALWRRPFPHEVQGHRRRAR